VLPLKMTLQQLTESVMAQPDLPPPLPAGGGGAVGSSGGRGLHVPTVVPHSYRRTNEQAAHLLQAARLQQGRLQQQMQQEEAAAQQRLQQAGVLAAVADAQQQQDRGYNSSWAGQEQQRVEFEMQLGTKRPSVTCDADSAAVAHTQVQQAVGDPKAASGGSSAALGVPVHVTATC
jgi:hypothetical protein